MAINYLERYIIIYREDKVITIIIENIIDI